MKVLIWGGGIFKICYSREYLVKQISVGVAYKGEGFARNSREEETSEVKKVKYRKAFRV